MILGSKDINRIRRTEGAIWRLLEERRWLAESGERLGPMWDFILGTKIEQVMDERGNLLERMTDSDINRVRNRLRNRLGGE